MVLLGIHKESNQERNRNRKEHWSSTQYESQANHPESQSASRFNFAVCTPSVPYGTKGTWDQHNSRDCLRRPDFIGIYEAYKDTPLDIKLIVMERDPVEMTLSAVRRKFAGHWGIPGYERTHLALEQAKWVEDSIIYIESQLEVLPDEIYERFKYDDFVNDPKGQVLKAANFIGISPKLLDANSVKKPVPKEGLESQRKDIEKFFSPIRCKQWPNYLA